MPKRSSPFGSTVAFVALVAALGVLASLVYLLIARPVVDAAGVRVSDAVADACPVGERAPVCYRFEVENTGDDVGTFACETEPPADSQASFQNGENRTVLILGPGQVESLFVKVTPLETDTVSEPSLNCVVNG